MENENQIKSKTQIKKEAEALQKLGEKLSKLPVQHLKSMGLPPALEKALIESQSITSNVAGRRQRQYIGALMREVDPAPIRRALRQTDTSLPIEQEKDRETRIWIDRLLTQDPAVMEEFLCTCPGLERQRLRQLLRNIKKEKKTKKPSKSLRSLEQLVSKSLESKKGS